MDNVNTDYELNVFSNSAGTIGQWYAEKVNEERRKDLSLLGDITLIYGGIDGISKKISNHSGVTVLGKYPAYEKLAKELNANYFKVPPDVWDNLEKTGTSWNANQKFLDRAIKRQDKFIFSDNVWEHTSGESSFSKELKYLKQKGYSITPDGKGVVR